MEKYLSGTNTLAYYKECQCRFFSLTPGRWKAGESGEDRSGSSSSPVGTWHLRWEAWTTWKCRPNLILTISFGLKSLIQFRSLFINDIIECIKACWCQWHFECSVLSVVYIIKLFWPNLCTKQCISLMILTEVMPIATKLHRKKFKTFTTGVW